MIDIFSYTNYRLFLKDLFEYNKKEHHYFSYRYLSKKAGFSSPNFFKLVIDGKRNLSSDSIETFARVFKLNKTESEYFKNLVLMDQAENTLDRKIYSDLIFNSSVFKKIQQINQDQYECYSHWYYMVIRELAGLENCPAEPEWIANKLNPQITSKEAKQAIESLIRLGFLVIDEKGFLKQVDQVVSTGNEIASIAVAQYHRAMMDLASRSIDKVNRKQRDISSVTLPLTSEGMIEVKEAIQKFRKEMLSISERYQSRDKVYQLGIQFFPLTNEDSV